MVGERKMVTLQAVECITDSLYGQSLRALHAHVYKRVCVLVYAREKEEGREKEKVNVKEKERE